MDKAEEAATRRVPRNVDQVCTVWTLLFICLASNVFMKYLGEFSEALGNEVKLLIQELGKLHEKRRTLQ